MVLRLPRPAHKRLCDSLARTPPAEELGEGGGLFVVNVFPDDEAHTRFGRNMGGPMEAVGLSNPQLEHLNVLAIRFQTI